MTPALAGCNSGSFGDFDLLSSSNCQATAHGSGAMAVGNFAAATGDHAVALGYFSGGSLATAGAVTVGAFAGYQNGRNLGAYSTVIGSGTTSLTAPYAYNAYGIAIGGGDGGANVGAVATDAFVIAIGTGAVARGVRSTAVGAFAGSGANAASSTNSAFGDSAGSNVNGSGNSAVGISSGKQVTGSYNTATGDNSGAFVQGASNAAVGDTAGYQVTGNYNVAMGPNAGRTVSGNSNVALGYNAGANITAANTIAIGTNAVGERLGAVAIGLNATASKSYSVAIGTSSVAAEPDTVSVGSTSKQRRITNVANAVNPGDAVNLRQVRSMINAATTVAAPAGLMPPLAVAAVAPAHAAATSRIVAERRTARAHPGTSHDAEPEVASNTAGDRAAHALGAERAGTPFEPSTIVGWANVNRDGTLAAARNVGGHARHAVGEYEIAFKQPLRHCTYHATLTDIGFVSVKPGSEAGSLNVQTRNHHGALTDAEFSLVVIC